MQVTSAQDKKCIVFFVEGMVAEIQTFLSKDTMGSGSDLDPSGDSEFRTAVLGGVKLVIKSFSIPEATFGLEGQRWLSWDTTSAKTSTFRLARKGEERDGSEVQ